MLCYSHLRTEQLIHISALSKLRKSAEISAVRYTNMSDIVSKTLLMKAMLREH